MLYGAWAIALTFALQHPQQTPTADSIVWSDDRPFERMIPNLGRDVLSLGTWDTVAIIGSGTAGALLVEPSDQRVAVWVADQQRSSYSKIGTHLGNGWVQGAAALGTYVMGKVTKYDRATHLGSDLVRAQVLNGLITGALKVSVNRTRPTGGPHSFPSGHSSATFASAAVLQGHFGWRVGVPAYAISGFVGWARFRDNQHWVSDVVAGSAIGVAVGHAVTAGHRPRSWSVVPVATKGGAGLYFIKY